jgi:hypothetical protein
MINNYLILNVSNKRLYRRLFVLVVIHQCLMLGRVPIDSSPSQCLANVT